ncbi:MAG: rod shape-determining protein MreC [Alistipes sp.]|nr:rod shape-determining protein MreC [Alistipes sp.]MBQ4539852.1 rod shape-determining protein MreC [Alistipes sp.]MBR7114585.1 rod shape-determining protein MreC [Alistipes sp.]
MYKLIELIRRIYVVLLFLLIEAVALNFYANSSHYTEAKILSRANTVAGWMQNTVFNVKHYFTLRSENEMLAQRVAELENTLTRYREREEQTQTDTMTMWQMDSTLMVGLAERRYTTARVVGNTIHHDRNYLTLNRGRQDGVVAEMAVVTPDGCMVGYVMECSDNYSVVMSILNTGFHTSGKIRGDEHFGSITWNGHSPHRVQMTELTKYSEFEIGDEVIASGLSHYFPEGVRIGYVESRTENENHTSLDVELRLAADMTRLSNVVLIENNNIVEITSLEELSKKE